MALVYFFFFQILRKRDVFPGPHWDSAGGIWTGTGEKKKEKKGKVLFSCRLVGLVIRTVHMTQGGPGKERRRSCHW